MKELEKNPHYDDEILYPAGVQRTSISSEDALDILYPLGVGPAGEKSESNDDDEILLPLLDS